MCPQFRWFVIWNFASKSFSLSINIVCVLEIRYNDDENSSKW